MIQTKAEPVVTEELALQHGLTAEEYQRILQILVRTPTYTELLGHVERTLQLQELDSRSQDAAPDRRKSAGERWRRERRTR